MKNKSIVLMALLIILSCLLVGCNEPVADDENPNDNQSDVIGQTNGNNEELKSDNDLLKPDRDANRYQNIEQNPIATIEMENGKIIKLELYPKIAPESVENFIELANSGFYNGLTFHRTIPGFMAQGGDPAGNGTGGPNYSIYGEFSENGFNNSLKHVRGVLSMARSDENNSAGSQFFIMVEDAEYLDGLYAAFGKVTEGIEVVDEIVNTEVIRREIDSDVSTLEEYYTQRMEVDRPVEPPKIKTITVDTFGVTYEAPTKFDKD